MHVETARSFLVRSARPHDRVAEPWTIAPTEIQVTPPSVSLLSRLRDLVRRWMG